MSEVCIGHVNNEHVFMLVKSEKMGLDIFLCLFGSKLGQAQTQHELTQAYPNLHAPYLL